MEKLVVCGGKKLSGKIEIKAAKNAVLPLLACCLLSKNEITLTGVEPLSDTLAMIRILKSTGAYAEYSNGAVVVNCKNADCVELPSELTGGIRSSVFILGALLGRFKAAKVSYPGGCEIGLRPIDLHLDGLRALNVKIRDEGGLISCDGASMSAGEFNLGCPSVGATENIMMAACLTSGITTIHNAAREPEIVDLARFINFLGGKVRGAGGSTIVIEGVRELGGGVFSPIGDRITAGTYLIAVAACGGAVELTGANPAHLTALLAVLRDAGACVKVCGGAVNLVSGGTLRAVRRIETSPYPGFATDLQAQTVAMLSAAMGSSVVVENLFESRFKYARELVKMGADINVEGRAAFIRGAKKLFCASVSAADLRGGAALVIAALNAEGQSEVQNVHHIDRGYYKIENELIKLGADIRRV